MTRTILIEPDGTIRDFEMKYPLEGLVDHNVYEVHRPTTLTDSTTDEDGRAVLLTATDVTLSANLKASALLYPASSRARHWVAGDALVAWEDETGLTGVPERFGAGDVRDLIEYFEKR